MTSLYSAQLHAVTSLSNVSTMDNVLSKFSRDYVNVQEKLYCSYHSQKVVPIDSYCNMYIAKFKYLITEHSLYTDADTVLI